MVSRAVMFPAAVLLVALVSGAAALQCYQCSGCEEGQRGHPVQCSSSQDACMKVVLGSRIEKSCSHSAACKLGDVEQSLTDVFSGLSSSITGDAKDTSDNSRVIHCCDDDYCNGASAVSGLSLLGLLFPALLGLLLR